MHFIDYIPAIKGKDKWLTGNGKETNFFLKETKCKHCDANDYAMEFIDKLQELREAYDNPIKILSGCRCKYYNDLIGGSKTSAHIPDPLARAADIYVPERDIKKVYMLAISYNFNGIGLYLSGHGTKFLHIDLKKRKTSPLYWKKLPYSWYKYTTDPIKNYIEYEKEAKEYG